MVVWLNLFERVATDRRLVFTGACSGAREDPPELGRLIAARRCSGFGSPLAGAQFESARRPHEVDRSEAGSGLQLTSSSELEASIKTAFGPIILGVFVAPVC